MIISLKMQIVLVDPSVEIVVYEKRPRYVRRDQ